MKHCTNVVLIHIHTYTIYIHLYLFYRMAVAKIYRISNKSYNRDIDITQFRHNAMVIRIFHMDYILHEYELS